MRLTLVSTNMFRFLAAVIVLVGAFEFSCGQELPSRDQRLQPSKTLNTPRTFPHIQTQAQWRERADAIRHQIQVSCGLWPLPDRTPLNPQFYKKIEREDYTIENVAIQTYPGFYLAGNLYRPKGKGNGPFPGVLNPHGHWGSGRLVDSEDGSLAARCISFARQGMVAFSYDMVGYNDTRQINHSYANQPIHMAWGISLMGLQTWNSIRALDFLESLPGVDKSRLACTGESGGGTQTFILGALDSRLAAQAPIVMVSHSMQGGCLCENAPGLRIDHSNMEIAAVPVPRPQILVAATGDWTKSTLEIEGPSIEKIYRLFNASDRFAYVRFDFGHNYNRTSREAVYDWFGKWLLSRPHPESLKEKPYTKEPDSDLKVWPNDRLPSDAIDETDLTQYLMRQAKSVWDQIQPTDRKSFDRFKEIMVPACRHTLQAEFPEKGLLVEVNEKSAESGLTRFAVGRAGHGDRLPVVMLIPPKDQHKFVVVLANPRGKAAYLPESAKPSGLARQLLEAGHSVVLLDTFLTGELSDSELSKSRQPFKDYFTTYNRTDLQERVQDLMTVCAFAQNYSKGRRVVLCGEGQAGLWSLLAAPAADAIIADCDQFDSTSTEAFQTAELFVPGILRIGGFAGVASRAAPRPMLVHNASSRFDAEPIARAYSSVNASHTLRREAQRMNDEAIVKWISELRLPQ